MQQYRPHYQRCQLLKEFVTFSWDPKSLKSLKLTSWFTLISSLPEVTIQKQVIFAGFAGDKRSSSSDAARLALRGRMLLFTSSPTTHSCAIPSSHQLCSCVRTFVCAVTQKNVAFAKQPPPAKSNCFLPS